MPLPIPSSPSKKIFLFFLFLFSTTQVRGDANDVKAAGELGIIIM